MMTEQHEDEFLVEIRQTGRKGVAEARDEGGDFTDAARNVEFEQPVWLQQQILIKPHELNRCDNLLSSL